ncbi:Maf-like protein [Neorhizobium sp. JUb45]|uniref:Maf-like protein n=1 Tax=unclassified Neorhizobium TaxID=2629175 RepID=UPI00247ADAA9|nr:Maf-like protein [Neorhizobium sp. JUb45]
MTPLVLASSSPFRRMLMSNAGLTFDHQAADIDERAIEAELMDAEPAKVATVLAEAKARNVAQSRPGSLVIGSDQTMSLGSRIYHKAASLEEAKDNLQSLSGKTHRLNSAVVIVRDDRILWEYVGHADLTMRPLSSEFVDHYLGRVGPDVLKSVGSYQLEGVGIQLFSKIDGDYFTIVGLPMLALLEKLRELVAIDG